MIGMLLLVSIPLRAEGEAEDEKCGATYDVPSGCRTYDAPIPDRKGELDSFQTAVRLYPTEAAASAKLVETHDLFTDFGSTVPVDLDFSFGDEQEIFLTPSVVTPGDVIGLIDFRIGTIEVFWSVWGNGIEPFAIAQEIFENLELATIANATDSEKVLSLLPELSDFPDGVDLELTDEVFLALPGIEAGSEQTPTTAELEATIAALQEQLDQSGGSSSGSSASNGAPLEILSIETKDAGTGDGSIYVYVEVRNNTSQVYDYVGLDGDCRDASDRIVGTGIGNTLNFPPNSTIVITMIMLNVPTCDTVHVRFDGFTR